MNNKAETVILIEKDKDDKEISKVEALHIRAMDFATFGFRINEQSLPELVEDMRRKFGMTLSAVYPFAYTCGIPKKKVKREVFYSKRHVDAAIGISEPVQPEYYTIAEAMEKYGLTRDQLYHYVKQHKVPKVQEGCYVKIVKKELDALLARPFYRSG